ncbi:hypothetical protein MGSAQ_001562, partial [marine sediment metagenome]
YRYTDRQQPQINALKQVLGL